MAGRRGGPKPKGEDIEPFPLSPIPEPEKVPETVNIAAEKSAAVEPNTRMVTIKVSRVGMGIVALKRESAGKVKVGNVMIDGVEMELGGKYRVPFTDTITKLARSKTVHIIG